ncbi:Predicted metal-dependent hydrolase, TIM-barrel fold [Nannocystis exedens]|uniref:Predicted metal-dependent hydrolase, TIM-barrel fold n=1 Tax=Nannocystis exedens TaxID=54 RepID=A0A1I2DB97_9BACT|nr:amidohydrolase family protein [Nannocystis exedens]PCC70611.1 2-pyrone-4,6-dicarboxylate hydrolase [Nannocystis exedens]SFE77804.1 Predicted metal-dependent hydrolase, TIM-barrel fold [Nannocystis exedens]
MIFDAHLHIIDPRFPLVQNHGWLPAPFDVSEYMSHATALGIGGGAVVSGSFQAFDQSYLEDALARLGPTYVGVTQLPADVADAEVLRLHDCGVRAVRFNLRRGGSADLADLEPLARRVFDLAGWHVELYVDSADLPGLAARLCALPRVSIDHLGLSAAGLPTLLALVERGVRVKATGFGRVDFDVAEVMRQIADVDPDALMFGTDLPSTRAPRPFAPADIDLLKQALGPELARRALRDNAIAWYRPAAT